MSGKIIISSVKTNVDNRKLEKDENGYYLINVGGFNVFNSAGDYYTAEGVKDLLMKPNGAFQRRLKAGNLRSEVEHPKFVPGMSKHEFFNRNLKIDLNNTCAHIRDVILEPTNDSSGYRNDKFILCKLWLKPSGVKGDALQKSLDNPDENTCFSIRSFTKDTFINGVNVKKLVQVITWDWVVEPGIATATKFKTLGVESMDEVAIELDDISNGDDISECLECSLESHDEKMLVKELIKNSKSESKYDIVNKW